LTWLRDRTFGAESVPTLSGLRARKHATGSAVAVVIAGTPADATARAIRACVQSDLIDDAGLVDEIVISDPDGGGRGFALRQSLAAIRSDIVLFLDGGIRNFSPRIAVRMIAPLLLEEQLVFIKGFAPSISPKSGGRAADHGMARPLLAASFPELDAFEQPFARETAARTALLRRLAFPPGEGVDAALLIDALEAAGAGALGQSDLGGSIHRTTPVSHYDGDIAMTVLRRAGERGRIRPFADATVYPLLVRDRASEQPDLPPIESGHAVRRSRRPRPARVAN